MLDNKKIYDRLAEFTHDLFNSDIYSNWRGSISNFELDKWYSVIVELDKAGCPISNLQEFGEPVYSKFVFRCIRSPDFRVSSERMILFSVSGNIWHSLIRYEAKTVE